MRPIRVQGRVVRRKPAHDHAAEFDGVEVKLPCSTSTWSDTATESKQRPNLHTRKGPVLPAHG